MEEHHTQISQNGQHSTPMYTFTETIADVYPGKDPGKPEVKIISKQIQDGELPAPIRETLEREKLRSHISY